MKYLRCVRPKKGDGLAAREGFFCAAYELRAKVTLGDAAYTEVERHLAWFRAHLSIPKRFSRSRAKGVLRNDHTAGLSWFKDSAGDVLML